MVTRARQGNAPPIRCLAVRVEEHEDVSRRVVGSVGPRANESGSLGGSNHSDDVRERLDVPGVVAQRAVGESEGWRGGGGGGGGF
jgi:hypothetical protein